MLRLRFLMPILPILRAAELSDGTLLQVADPTPNADQASQTR